MSEIASQQVVVTIREHAEGEVNSRDVMGWTTNCPELAITPKGRFHVLTHTLSGAAIVNEGASMPDLYRLADLLSVFDWSSPDIYETKPPDWVKRTEVVRAWYLDVYHDEEAANAL